MFVCWLNIGLTIGRIFRHGVMVLLTSVLGEAQSRVCEWCAFLYLAEL